jgi:four helix bundle protein
MTESQNLRISEEPKVVNYVRQFKDLDVYQKAFNISLDIHTTSLDFPKIEQFAGIADQMRRASKSICANIAEGFAKQQRSKPEFKRFLLMDLGSAEEMQVWIEYARALGYVPQAKVDLWGDTYNHIVKMLQSLYSKV